MKNQNIKGKIAGPVFKGKKWTTLFINIPLMPAGAILKIEEHLYKVKRRLHLPDGRWMVYVEEYKPIVVRKTV